MEKHLLFRAFLPLAAYAVFTELALHGLAGILAAASDGWTGAVSLNLSAAVLWANAAAGLAVSGLFWRQYGREEEEGKVPGRRLDLRREKIGSFLLLIALGICCCLGGSGLIFLLGEGFSGTISSGSLSAEAISAGAKAAAAPGTAFSLATLFLCSGCIIPFAEEFLFRRAMYGSLREIRRLGRAGALILSSVMFGLYHGQLLQGIYAGLLGCLLAFLYERKRTLAVPVIVHASANSAAVLLETACYGTWLESRPGVLLIQTGAAVFLAAVILRHICRQESRAGGKRGECKFE